MTEHWPQNPSEQNPSGQNPSEPNPSVTGWQQHGPQQTWQQPGWAPRPADPNQGWAHTPPRYHRAVTVGALVAGAVVVLVALVFGLFLLLGGLNGSKVSTDADFREKMRQFGSEHGMSHCADYEEVAGSSSESLSSSGVQGYVCADQDLTQDDSALDAPRVVIGYYSSDASIPETQVDTDTQSGRLAWTLVGEHWMLQTNDHSSGSREDAQDLFGGHEPQGRD